MPKKTSSTKEVTLSLFALTETEENITTEIQNALKDRKSVEERTFNLGEDKGVVCAMDVRIIDGIVLMHVARFESGASVDVIRHSADNMKKDSLEVDVKSPEKDSDFLKTQAVALFDGNMAILMVSDGREFSLVWSFVYKLLGKFSFAPKPKFSEAIVEAIEQRGIKYIRLNGFANPKSVKKALKTADMRCLDFCTSNSSDENKNSSVKVELKFSPEKNVKELFRSFFTSDNKGVTAFESDDGIFSVVAETAQGEKIKKDGFCRAKKVRFDKYGSFVYRQHAYEELILWYKELKKNNEWTTE